MAKELTHRADELKGLGLGQEDIFRYTELWEYRQRWGSINLEREDRLFLKKIESSLPEISKTKSSVKKSIKEKSYYRWLSLYLNEMKQAEINFKIEEGAKGLWAILLEEEIRALDYYEPVLGLPDTLKAKLLKPLREEIVGKYINLNKTDVQSLKFDFESPIKSLSEDCPKSWKPLRDGDFLKDKDYPVVKANIVESFRNEVRKQLLPAIKETFPSLIESEKPSPPQNWTPNSISLAKKEDS